MTTIRFLLAAAATAAVATSAQAQAWPAKPIRLIVPFPPGGGTDILSRLIGQKLTEQAKWTIVPDNKGGAGGTIGITEATKAAPTGYDLVMGQKDNLVIGPWLYKNLPWDPTRDLVAVAHVAYSPVIIATSANSKFKTLADVIAAAKAAPGKVTYGSPGSGTSIHLAGHLFEKAAGIDLNHVPYKGSNPALMDALAGNVDLLVSSVPSAMGQIKSGKLRALAVTSLRRSSSLPDVPTVAESGYPRFDATFALVLFAPKDVPAPIVQKMHAEMAAALRSPEMAERLAQSDQALAVESPADTATHLAQDSAKWREVEVHTADLNAGIGFADWNQTYVRYDLPRMTMLQTSRRPMGMTSLPEAALRLTETDRLAWLLGRHTPAGLEPQTL